jgi:hypothetical protein
MPFDLESKKPSTARSTALGENGEHSLAGTFIISPGRKGKREDEDTERFSSKRET